MTDTELREQIGEQLKRVAIESATQLHNREKHGKKGSFDYMFKVADNLVDLTHSYAEAWADKVIGEDEWVRSGKSAFEQGYVVDNLERRTRNEHRAELRSRNHIGGDK